MARTRSPSAGGESRHCGGGCVDGDWFLVEGRSLLAEEGGVGRDQSLLRVLAMHHQTLRETANTTLAFAMIYMI